MGVSDRGSGQQHHHARAGHRGQGHSNRVQERGAVPGMGVSGTRPGSATGMEVGHMGQQDRDRVGHGGQCQGWGSAAPQWDWAQGSGVPRWALGTGVSSTAGGGWAPARAIQRCHRVQGTVGTSAWCEAWQTHGPLCRDTSPGHSGDAHPFPRDALSLQAAPSPQHPTLCRAHWHSHRPGSW